MIVIDEKMSFHSPVDVILTTSFYIIKMLSLNLAMCPSHLQ